VVSLLLFLLLSPLLHLSVGAADGGGGGGDDDDDDDDDVVDITYITVGFKVSLKYSCHLFIWPSLFVSRAPSFFL
jgi:hypothetical protein